MISNIFFCKDNCLEQRFSTWGTRTLGIRAKVTGGTQKLKKCSKEALFGRIFDLGVREGLIFLIWGYPEGTILIWGYAGTKRLRTPGLEYIGPNTCQVGYYCQKN
jgi:hypothetical protein